MDLRIKGRSALVTGASGGLGLATAVALAKEGVRVVINSRDSARLAGAAKEIESVTGHLPGVAPGDLSDSESIKAVVKTARDHLNTETIDVLVSNAGGPPPGQFLDHDPSAWDKAAKLVLDMAVGLTREVLPSMIAQHWGRLVYITSVGVLQPVDALILSNTYRAGVTGFCKTISNNYAKHGVTANCVCPGYTATERLSSLAEKTADASGKTTDEAMADFAASVPAGRVGKPEELGSLIAYLASEHAAYITGASIPVDGGSHRGLL